MTTKVLTIIFAILAGVSVAICFGGILFGYILLAVGVKKDRKELVSVALKMKEIGVGILFGYILLAVGVKKDRKELVSVALKMKEIGVGICSKAFILTFIFLFLMSK